MRRTRTLWLAFASCLALVLAAMAWISVTAVRSDRAERQANRQAAAEEKIRLALVEMDSALLPLIVQESARPYFVYESFHPLDNVYTRIFRQLRTRDVLVASPLLDFQSPDILLHFQIGPDEALRSPQVPKGNFLDVATDGYVTGERVDVFRERLARLGKIMDRPRLLAMLPAPPPPPASTSRPVARAAPRPDQNVPVQQQATLADLNKLAATRARRQFSRTEATQYLNTANAVARYLANDQAQLVGNLAFHPAVAPAAVAEGPLRPCWIGGALLLARRVSIGDKQTLQGCWLHWEHIRAQLLAATRDLLPAADLLPAPADEADPHAYALAALPLRLVPGPVRQDLSDEPSAAQWSLLIAWFCVLLGAAAVAVLLGKAVSLSERRGAFVSAVTHELRTPLTTFRLYTEMLAGGMIGDEDKRRGYLRRLRDEADRLSHLVENVLAYARLAGPRSAAHLESVPLGDIVDRSRERLEALCERSDMQFLVETDPDALGTAVRCNASAVEQILLNLVDNACKYAGRCEDRRIYLRTETRDALAAFSVCDHGPGISRADRKRLFRPFRKSAHKAAQSAPGIGLGLALSRRLARNMGGDLRCEPPSDVGTSFLLTLPLAGD